jgi:hypothetical protein
MFSRKLAAIFAVDVEHHWRCMGIDQEGTLDRLRVT